MPVTYVVSASTTNYSAALTEACAKFTQDNHVAFVLDPGAYYDNAFEACLAKANTPTVIAGYATGDSASYRSYPMMFNAGTPSVDRRLSAMLNDSAATGWLTKANKLGVIIDGCAYNIAAYNRTLVPLAKRIGVRVESSTFECAVGYGSLGSVAQSIQSAVLKFRSDGVDRVMSISSFEAVTQLLIANGAQSQGWNPGYIVSSAAAMGAQASNYPPSQLANIHGAGWIPSLDITTQPSLKPQQQRCRALMKSQGITPTSNTDLGYIYGACDQLFLPEAALKANGANATPAAFVSALNGLGSRFASALSLGTTYVGPGQHDAPAQSAAFSYMVGCSCLAYIEAPRHLA